MQSRLNMENKANNHNSRHYAESNSVKWLAYATAAGMLLVLLMGALVTKTGSGRGCGDDWPLCNGKFIPAYTIESMIEYSHRFVTGVIGMILLVTVIQVFRHVKRNDARFYALASAFFTVVQSIMGAFAVLWPQSDAVMALHFGISLLAFAGTFLLAVVVRQWHLETGAAKTAAGPERTNDGQSGRQGNVPQISPGFAASIWMVTIYCYIVVYIGAFVRHSESYGGCSGWPLCNGKIIPELAGAPGIVFGHRVAALLLFIAILWLYIAAVRHMDRGSFVRKSALWALILITLQVLSGAFVTLAYTENMNLLASLLHTVIVSALFAVLCFLCSVSVRFRN